MEYLWYQLSEIFNVYATKFQLYQKPKVQNDTGN